METLLFIAKMYSPAVALITFLLWRDYKRDKEQAKINADLQLFIRTKLVELIEDCIESAKKSTAVQKNLFDTLQLRPCIRNDVGG